jgi:hypothetical protein
MQVEGLHYEQGEQMSLYYVPALLVIEAPDEGDADSRAEAILDTLPQLGIQHYIDYTLVGKVTPASHNWYEKDQRIEGGSVVEKEMT